MGRPELPLAFAMLLFGPSLLALGAGLVFLVRVWGATAHAASAWPADGAALDYAPPPPMAESGRMGRFLLLLASAVPTALFALCAVALMDGRSSLGHWPRPIDTVAPLAYASFLVSMVYMLLQFLIVPAAILAAVLRRRNRLAAVSLLVYGAASLATLGFVWFSPLGPWVIGD